MKNQFVTHGNTAYIILPPGDKAARIDLGDLDRVDAYPGMWRLHGRYLEMCHLDTFYRMRRVVINVKDEKDFVIMHRDGDPLNLKRNNLVLAPRGAHVQNRDKPNKNNRSSGVRGVTWHKKAEKWMATCTVDRKTMYLGLYPTLDEAKRAAEEARRVHMPLSTEHLIQKEDSHKHVKINRVNVPPGARYGRLTVVSEVPPDEDSKYRRFICRCDCGNTVTVIMGLMRSGQTQSCGCLQAERVSQKNTVDLTGRRFGKLIVLERVPSIPGNRKVLWRCQCDCGNITAVRSTSLTRGKTQSCGCIREEAAKRFGQRMAKRKNGGGNNDART